MIEPHGTDELEAELSRLQQAARERRSVDGFARAALEGLLWALLAGVCGKVMWDSARLPFFFYPLALLDLLLLWDSARVYARATADLRREQQTLRRLRALRAQLGIDPPSGAGPEPAVHP
jgi:hypothetical protein